MLLKISFKYEEKSSATRFVFVVGCVISAVSSSLLIFSLSMLLFFTHKHQLNDGEVKGTKKPFFFFVKKNKGEMTKEQYVGMMHALLGFGVGVCFSALFYREATGQASRGIIAGEELIGKVIGSSRDDEQIR